MSHKHFGETLSEEEPLEDLVHWTLLANAIPILMQLHFSGWPASNRPWPPRKDPAIIILCVRELLYIIKRFAGQIVYDNFPEAIFLDRIEWTVANTYYSGWYSEKWYTTPQKWTKFVIRSRNQRWRICECILDLQATLHYQISSQRFVAYTNMGQPKRFSGRWLVPYSGNRIWIALFVVAFIDLGASDGNHLVEPCSSKTQHRPQIWNVILLHIIHARILFISLYVSVQLVPATHPSKKDQGLPSSLYSNILSWVHFF